MKISALWITKNEEKNIARTMESVADVADELVVVDTGSTDRTVEIAEALGARVVHFEWIDDFAAARNFALQQVDGDVVIFLDADEWFEPKLNSDNRRWLEEVFYRSASQAVRVVRDNIDPKTGLSAGKDKMARIFRGHNAIEFLGVIHERPRVVSGGMLKTVTMPDAATLHNGYASEVFYGKLLRNRVLLAQAVENAPDDIYKTVNTYYLMRESMGLQDASQALRCLVWLVNHPKLLREFFAAFPLGRTMMFNGMELGYVLRSYVSRQQLKRVLIDSAKAAYPDFPGVKIIDLYYDTYFDHREGVLLAELEPAIEKAEKMVESDIENEDYYRGKVRLYTMAGEAAWRRGNRELAFEYASKAVQQSETMVTPEAVALLLRCVRGLPSEDIIQFLNSILGIEKRGTLWILVSTTQFEGFKDVYAYYMKKMLDAGWAKKSDFWLLLIALGKAEEAAEAAWQMREESSGDVVPRTLFLAAVCSQNEAMFRQYAEATGNYRPLLEAFFTGRTDEDLSFEEMHDNYQIIAFAAGRHVANRLLEQYEGMNDQRFTVMANYYNNSGLYEEFLAECPYFPDSQVMLGRLQLANCHLMTGSYAVALQTLESIHAENGLDDTWFNICAVIAENGPPDIAARARKMYDESHEWYERCVDWLDVVRTNAVMDSDTKQARRELAGMTQPQLVQRLAPTDWRPFIGLAETAFEAAAVLLPQKAYAAAAECLFTALRYEYKPKKTLVMMGELFDKVENTALAEFVRLRASALPDEVDEADEADAAQNTVGGVE